MKSIKWKYAIGEVIIVILGLSIAFSINRWWESHKNDESRREYLESLISDLGHEEEHLQENVAMFNQKINLVRHIYPYFGGLQDGRDTIARQVFELAAAVHFHHHEIGYKTLLNSGDLSLFEDFELRKALEDHYSNHALIELDYSRPNIINERHFGDYLIHQMDYQQMRAGNYSFLDDRVFQNIIHSLNGSFNLAVTASQEGIENCKALRERLQIELDQIAPAE